VRYAAEEQHRRHVLPIDTHTKVQAQFGAVTWLDAADELASANSIARRQR
jgi:hypothetical protein